MDKKWTVLRKRIVRECVEVKAEDADTAADMASELEANDWDEIETDTELLSVDEVPTEITLCVDATSRKSGLAHVLVKIPQDLWSGVGSSRAAAQAIVNHLQTGVMDEDEQLIMASWSQTPGDQPEQLLVFATIDCEGGVHACIAYAEA